MNKKTKMYKNVVFCTEIADMNNIPACLLIFYYFIVHAGTEKGAL